MPHTDLFTRFAAVVRGGLARLPDDLRDLLGALARLHDWRVETDGRDVVLHDGNRELLRTDAMDEAWDVIVLRLRHGVDHPRVRRGLLLARTCLQLRRQAENLAAERDAAIARGHGRRAGGLEGQRAMLRARLEACRRELADLADGRLV